MRLIKGASLLGAERRESLLSSPTAQRIAKVRAARQAIEREIEVRVAPKRPTDPGERLAYELRQRETRDELRKLSPLERAIVLAATQDPAVIDAIETAPPALDGKRLAPFVNPKAIDEARLARARASDPERAAESAALLRRGVARNRPQVRHRRDRGQQPGNSPPGRRSWCATRRATDRTWCCPALPSRTEGPERFRIYESSRAC